GQIVISAETARRQARRLEVALASELDLLVTHGVLHLVGYDDRDPVEARLMHERERQILTAGRRPPPARLWRGLLETANPPRITHPKRPGVRSIAAPVSGPPRPKPASRPAIVNPSRITHPKRPGVRSIAAPVSGHPRSKPASRPAIVNPSRITHPKRPGVRSIAAPVSGHPRSKPASRHPLQ